MKIFVAVSLLFFSAFVSFAPAFADDVAYENELARQWKLMPRAPKILRDPSTESWQVYGLNGTPRLTASDGAIGGKALKVKVKSAAPNPWDIGVQAHNQVKISKGDVIVGAFSARASNLPKGTTATTLPYHLQMANEPYTAFGSVDAAVTPDWNVYYVHGTAPMDFAKGTMNLALHVGGGRHTLEFGPVFLWSLGAGDVDPEALPTNSSSSDATPVQNPANKKPPASAPANNIEPEILADLAMIRASAPHTGELLNNPDVSLASAYGEDQSFEHVSDKGVPGGKAIQITVNRPGLNSWSAGINWPTYGDVAKGDTVLLAYWAKAVTVHNEAQSGNISAARVQQSQAPHDSAADQAASLDKTWRLYYAQGISGSKIDHGSSGISFHAGLAKQTIRIGPAYVLNYGPGVDPAALPRTRLSYEGMEEGAPWRQKALDDIDLHRKANLAVKVVDEAGNPVANAKVHVKMTEHAFNFGTFVGHEFVKGSGETNETYHKSFHDNFNMATAPLYWQDWGWNGGFAENYRRTVKYLHNNEIRWRGHPIVWPGEAYMPTKIKAENADVKQQRKLVLDHVREVMAFVKAYDPIAVDMVNEVRTNQYFIDQGDPDLIKDAFKMAHEIAPDIPLFVNDYGILNSGGLNLKSIEFYHDWIKKMRGDNVPLGGIGFQAHFGAGLTPPARVIEILDSFAVYDLPLHITEFDVDTLDADAQAAYTRDMLIAVFSQPQVDAFVVWGWWEGDHWKPAAAMLRKDWSERPNYKAWRDLVHDQWWTDELISTDENGFAKVRGFKGAYDIKVNSVLIQHNLTRDDALTVIQ